MPPETDERRPVGTEAAPELGGLHSTTPQDRFVMIPLRLRREHRDWSDSEVAVWLDLFLASYELGGRFESWQMVQAIVGVGSRDRTGNTLEDLVERGALAGDDDEGWTLVDFDRLYDGRRPRHFKSLEQHLLDAEEKIARGEPLSSIERWARWKARQNGAVLPDPRKRASDDEDDDEDREGDIERPNVGQTFANVSQRSSTPCPECESGVLRSKKGKLGRFLSCSRYPDCTYSKDLPTPSRARFEPDIEEIRRAHGGALPPGMVA